MGDVSPETAEALRELSAGHPPALEALLGVQLENLEDSGLDPRSYALVKVASLIALEGPSASLCAQVGLALDAGATPEELLGVLVAVAPQVGLPRVVATAPALLDALVGRAEREG